MATIIEQLLETMTPEEKAVIRRKLAENPALITADAEAGKILAIYNNAPDDAAAEAARVEAARVEAERVRTASAVHVPTVPNTSAVATTPTTVPGAGDKAITDALAALNSKLDGFETKFVKAEDVGKFRQDILVQSLKINDEMSTARETYRREFGKELDRTTFETFINAAQDTTTGRNKYSSITAAFNEFVAEDRIAARVTKEVAEQVKQKLSGAAVPGSTHATALSPAQQVVAKAKDASRNTEKSNVQAAIDALALRERAGSNAVQ